MLALAMSTVSGMTSKTIGLAILEVLTTLTGMNDASVGSVMLFSLALYESSVKEISTTIFKKPKLIISYIYYIPQ